jgi:phage shock protein A
MTFFRRISDSVPIVANQEPQTEITPPKPSEPQTNFGIAQNLDLYETVARTGNQLEWSNQAEDLLRNKENISNVMDRLSPISGRQEDSQNQSAVEMGSSATQNNMMVDVSNLFSYIEPNAVRFNEQLAQLNDQLKSLKERRDEIRSQMVENKTKALELKQAASEIRGAMAEGKPIPDSLMAILGPLGILGMIGGLPALPVIGGIAGLVGLNLDYKNQMAKAAAELEKRAGLMDMDAQSLREELEEMTKEEDSIREKIEHLNEKQQELNAPAKNFMGSSSMVAEQAVQVFENDENMIQNDASSAITLNPADVTKDNS